MTLSYQERQTWFSLRREDQITHRKEFWRSLAGINEVEEEHEEYAEYRAKLSAAIYSWHFDLYHILESRVEEYPQIKALWEHVDLSGHATGLSSALDILRDDDARPPVDFFRSVGVALNNAAVLLFDLPKLPPVIEDPWDHSEPTMIFNDGEGTEA